MRVFKKILIGFGAVFLVIVALIAWLGVKSTHFKAQQEPFVRAFVADLSKRWEIDDVYSRLSNAFIEQVNTAEGREVIQRFKQLGPLKSMQDLELNSYYFGTNGNTGVFSFKAIFENGEAVLKVTVVTKDNVSRVQGIYITGVHVVEGRGNARIKT